MTVEQLLSAILQYGTNMALGALLTAVTVLYINYKALNDGMRSLLRNAINIQCERYIATTYIPTHSRENIEGMYASYHKLKGNGSVSSLVEQVRDLPPEKLVVQEMKGDK